LFYYIFIITIIFIVLFIYLFIIFLFYICIALFYFIFLYFYCILYLFIYYIFLLYFYYHFLLLIQTDKQQYNFKPQCERILQVIIVLYCIWIFIWRPSTAVSPQRCFWFDYLQEKRRGLSINTWDKFTPFWVYTLPSRFTCLPIITSHSVNGYYKLLQKSNVAPFWVYLLTPFLCWHPSFWCYPLTCMIYYHKL